MMEVITTCQGYVFKQEVRTRKYGIKAWRRVKSVNHYMNIQTRQNLTT